MRGGQRGEGGDALTRAARDYRPSKRKSRGTAPFTTISLGIRGLDLPTLVDARERSPRQEASLTLSPPAIAGDSFDPILL